MIIRIQILKSDLAHMCGTLDPANVTTQDLVKHCRDWRLDMMMVSVIYYEEGARRYYWKNRVTGKAGWDDDTPAVTVTDLTQ
jgi:hypothetical protein